MRGKTDNPARRIRMFGVTIFMTPYTSIWKVDRLTKRSAGAFS
jgi:hypothetical protein